MKSREFLMTASGVDTENNLLETYGLGPPKTANAMYKSGTNLGGP